MPALTEAQEHAVERIVATFFVRVLEVYAEAGDEIARNALDKLDASLIVKEAERVVADAANESRADTLLRRGRYSHGPPPDD